MTTKPTITPADERAAVTALVNIAENKATIMDAVALIPFLPDRLRLALRGHLTRHTLDKCYPGKAPTAAAKELAADLRKPSNGCDLREILVWAIRKLNDDKPVGRVTLYNATLAEDLISVL